MKYTNWILSAATALALAACATQPNEREMNYLGSALTKVAAAVDATVRYRNPPAGLSEIELLQRATAHDPSLLRPFGDMKVRVRREGLRSAVLVCDSRGNVALLEDTACTPGTDAHRWSRVPKESCEFTLDLERVCSR